MTDKPTGVFIDLSGAKITAEQEAKARDAIANAPPGLGNYLSAVLLAIGTPVMGGELDVVGYEWEYRYQVGEDGMRKYVWEKKFTVSSPEDRDPDTWRNSFPIVRQSDALAKLAEKDAEIARLNELSLHSKRENFNAGYLLACCNIVNLHNEEGIAADILNELGITEDEVKALDLAEYDAKALAVIREARSADPILKGPEA